jgi:hypothetical protein
MLDPHTVARGAQLRADCQPRASVARAHAAGVRNRRVAVSELRRADEGDRGDHRQGRGEKDARACRLAEQSRSLARRVGGCTARIGDERSTTTATAARARRRLAWPRERRDQSLTLRVYLHGCPVLGTRSRSRCSAARAPLRSSTTTSRQAPPTLPQLRGLSPPLRAAVRPAVRRRPPRSRRSPRRRMPHARASWTQASGAGARGVRHRAAVA